jgi:hypothetical protein
MFQQEKITRVVLDGKNSDTVFHDRFKSGGKNEDRKNASPNLGKIQSEMRSKKSASPQGRRAEKKCRPLAKGPKKLRWRPEKNPRYAGMH